MPRKFYLCSPLLSGGITADLVEIGNNARLLAALAESQVPTDGEPIKQISERLSKAAQEEAQLVATLNNKLGARVRKAGGDIDSRGTITLPESVLFEDGEDKVKDPRFLIDFCGPWIETLRNSKLEISDIKIEGHASSEWKDERDPNVAYLNNLGLSQRRAQNALADCLDGVLSDASLAWARAHLAAVGYSSTRLITHPDGSEDRERSRRVMFSVSLDRSRLIEGIGRDVSRSDLSP